MWQKYFFVSKIPHKEEHQLHVHVPPNTNIQETDPLLSLRFGTWRFRVLFVETFVLHLAAEFLCERNSKRNIVAFFIGRIRLGIPIERVVFSDCSRFWNSKSWLQQILCHPSHPSDFFTAQMLGGHVVTQPGYFSQRQKEAVERTFEWGWVFLNIHV